jgi:hypothetical protein
VGGQVADDVSRLERLAAYGACAMDGVALFVLELSEDGQEAPAVGGVRVVASCEAGAFGKIPEASVGDHIAGAHVAGVDNGSLVCGAGGDGVGNGCFALGPVDAVVGSAEAVLGACEQFGVILGLGGAL